MSNNDVARLLLSYSFDGFIEILPNVYKKEGHMMPQRWTRQARLGRLRLFDWPFIKTIRLKDGGTSLEQIPDIDFSKKSDQTSHLDNGFEINDEHWRIPYKLYQGDYRYGGYKPG